MSTKNKEKAPFTLRTIDQAEAETEITTQRTGGRSSVFEPILEQIDAMKVGKVVVIEGLKKNQVAGLRTYIRGKRADLSKFLSFRGITRKEGNKEIHALYVERQDKEVPVRKRKKASASTSK